MKARRSHILGLAILTAVSALAGCRGEPRPNVLLVTFDTTRADHFGCYGNDTVETPTVDSLASEGVLFEQAVAAVPLTHPSHSTILTGTLPFTHGIRDNGLFTLADAHTTLAEVLSEAGWATGAAVASFPLISRFGLDQGFDLYDDELGDGSMGGGGGRDLFFDERKAARVNDAIVPWIEDNAHRPFFAWVHYFDPHQPHEAPAPYDLKYPFDPYAAEIAYADESLGVLFDHLRRLGVWDDTLVVFTADHGEGLGSTALTHSLLLYQSTLHVPLVIKAPGGPAGKRVERRVATASIMPTVLERLGLDIPEAVQASSLADELEPGPPLEVRRAEPIYAETLSPRLSFGWGELRALVLEPYKYVHGPRPELYDLGADPGELDNLVEDRPELARRLRARLVSYLDRHWDGTAQEVPEVDPDTMARLAALGYLSSSGADLGPIQERLDASGDAPQDRVADISDHSQAKAMIIQRRPMKAKAIAEGLLRRDPDNPATLEVLAAAELQMGRTDAVLDAFGRILGGPNPSFSRDRIAGHLERLPLSDAQARRVLGWLDHPSGHGSAGVHYLLAKLEAGLGNHATALGHLDRCLELAPAMVRARMSRGIALARLDRADEARRELERAVAAEPWNANLVYNHGVFLYELGELREAADRFETAVGLEPDYARAHLALITALAELGDNAASRHRLDVFQERLPRDPLIPQARRAASAEPTSS